MLLIPRSQIWTQQPPDPAAVADVPGLAFALLPQGDTFVDVVSGQQGVINNASGNGAPTVGATGRALYGPNSNFYAQSLAVPGAAFGTGDFAVGIVGSFETIAAAVVALSNDAFRGAGSNQWRMQPNYNGSSTSSGAFSFFTYGGSTVACGANSLFANGSDYSFLGVRRGTTVELWRDGVKVASNTGTAQNVSGAETQSIGFGWGTGVSTNAGGNRYLGYGIRGTLTPEQAASLSANPWQIFERQDAQIIIPLAVGGPVTHATSGTLAAASAGISGAAARARAHGTSGTVAADAATVSGSAARAAGVVTHATIGGMTAAAAGVSGTAARTRQHVTDGALTAGAAATAGAATQHRVHATSGTMAAGSAATSGQAARMRAHAAAGALAATAATTSGQAALPGPVTHSTGGALAAGSSTVAGTARHQAAHASTGTLAAGLATVSGAAQRIAGSVTHSTSGAMVAGSSTVVGTSTQRRVHAAAGDLAAGGATVAGLAAVGAVIPDQPALFAPSLSRVTQFSGSIQRTVNFRASYG